MSSLRACVILLVMLVQFQSIISKPFFFDLICDFICDDDDTSTTTSSSTEDDYFDFCDCTPTTRRPNNRNGQALGPPSFNMRLPPSNGVMNISMVNKNGVWELDIDAPQNGFGGPPPAGGPTTPAPTTAAGDTTAAAGTTAAATTAKK